MLHDLFRHAVHQPNAVAFIDEENEISFRDLALRVAGVADGLTSAGAVAGILAPNGIDWVVAYLGAMLANKTIVPLPLFFSDSQLRHIIADSGVSFVLGPQSDRMKGISPETRVLETPSLPADHFPDGCDSHWQLVIYTSGTTGTPKGVRLESPQVSASVLALASAILPAEDDRYLSVLPFTLLLEQVTGILLPIHVGVCSHISAQTSHAALTGDMTPFMQAVEDVRPSISVMVPSMLEVWLLTRERLGAATPRGLRFVAVGGAHVPATLIQQARNAGIPAFEGYGLSECCSVVAVNVPTADRLGSVGQPLPGLTVSIEDGEIVVAGPSVMTGYLGGDDIGGVWHTRDLGFVDDEGFLHVQGRADNMLITSRGRNLSPEWIEGMIEADARIGRCIVYGQGLPTPGAIIVPSTEGVSWFRCARQADVLGLVRRLCREAPTYACPGTFTLIEEPFFREGGFIDPNGKVHRQTVEAHFNPQVLSRSDSK